MNNPFVAAAPAGLLAELEQREARIEFSWSEGDRAFARAQSPGGNLFARYSADPEDVALFEHDTAVRRIVGSEGPLRSPPVLAEAPGWRIELGVSAEPWSGPDAVDAAAAAAAAIPALDLPAPPRSAPSSRFAAFLRFARTRARAIGIGDLRAARRELATTDLPTVTCHRDFHPKNILMDEGGAWIIDWERTSPGPLGLDHLRLWTSLADPADRDRAFERAVELVGEDRRASLRRLLYGVAVAEAQGLQTARNPFDRDDAALGRLLELIPGLRPGR